jgi:ribulose kinase
MALKRYFTMFLSALAGVALCASAQAACDEEQYRIQRAQRALEKKQEKLNENPGSQKHEEEKLEAWQEWQKAKEELATCIQKDRDSSWQSKPAMNY